jgi:hypothetical protein
LTDDNQHIHSLGFGAAGCSLLLGGFILVHTIG